MNAWKPSAIGGRKPAASTGRRIPVASTSQTPARRRAPMRRPLIQIVRAHRFGGEVVGDEFLATRDRLCDPHEHRSVPGKRELQNGFATASERADGAAYAAACLVDPWAETRIAAVVVTELVREHRSKLSAGQRSHER
jgi:hypothetical protein